MRARKEHICPGGDKASQLDEREKWRNRGSANSFTRYQNGRAVNERTGLAGRGNGREWEGLRLEKED